MIKVELESNSISSDLYNDIVAALDMVMEDARKSNPNIVISYTTMFSPICDEVEEVSVETYIPVNFVPMDYQAHSDTEKIVRGRDLEEGDVILVADSVFRENPNRPDAYNNEYIRDRLYTKSRWCRVTQLEKKTAYQQSLISYIGVYADGSISSHTYNESIYFIVKK